MSRRAARRRKPQAPPAATWRVAAASVRGTSHAATGAPCQDAHAWSCEAGLLLAAVADGAGTASLSEHGAAEAARVAVDALRALASSGGIRSADQAKDALADAFRQARDSVDSKAAEMQADPRELATTLTAAVVSADWVAAAQVGDGAVVVRSADGGLATLTAPDGGGEYLNETVFLTSPGALDSLSAVTYDGRTTHVALLTDGLQMLALKMPGREPHPPFFDPLFRFAQGEASAAAAAERLAAFLAGPRVSARADDDLTLVIAAMAPESGEAA